MVQTIVCSECGDSCGSHHENKSDVPSSYDNWDEGAGHCPICEQDLCESCAQWEWEPPKPGLISIVRSRRICSKCRDEIDAQKIKKIT